MCGMAGVIGSDPELVRNATERAADALVHRGPDDHGTALRRFGRKWVGLGHCRLSILDLSPLGHQPMIHSPTGCIIIFNGEIYNFHHLRAELRREGDEFRSHCDTEVLLAGLVRHGQSFLARLEGMYAFAFFDPRTSSLLLARDPAGMKPLYFAETQDGLVFASETRAILATGLVKPRIDRRGIAGFLAYGAVQHPHTVFDGVRSLPPGACLLLKPDLPGAASETHTASAFWRFPEARAEMTESRACDAIRRTLDLAVRDHLVADVPVGLFLSSGLDSTILAGLAARHSPSMRSLTVIFSGEPDINEQRLARETANQFGLEHTEISVSSAAAEAAVQDWLGKLDQPSIDGLNVFVISEAARERGIKVALTGLGGDELFGGYPSFRDVPRLSRMMRFLRPVPTRLRHHLVRVGAMGRSSVARAKLQDITNGNGALRSIYLQRRRLMSDCQLKRLGCVASNLGLDSDFLDPDDTLDIDDTEEDAIRAISQLEFRLYQGNMLLRDADANGMAFGLEIRVPFLDQRLLNLVHAIPGSVRLPPRANTKHLLRRAFADLVRPEILAQHKRGFVLPIRRWMAGPLRVRCEQSLVSLRDSRLLNADGISEVWSAFLEQPGSSMWTRAFSLVVLGDYIGRAGAEAA